MKPVFQCPLDRSKTERLFRFALIIANVFFMIALAVYAYRGFFSRYWADDYCFGSIFHQNGLFAGTGTFYREISNRFAAFFLVGLSELLGEVGIQLMPAIMIVLIILVYFKVFERIFDLLKFPQKWFVLLLLSQVLTFFMLYTAPSLFQSLFWRSGMVSYYAPIPFLGVALILIFNAVTRGLKWYAYLLLGMITFFSAGLSETYAALETGLFALAILATVIFVKKKAKKRLLLSAGVAILGSLSAMLVMVLAPGNAMRLATLEQATSIGQIITISLLSAAAFAYQSLRGFSIPTVLLFGLVAILGYHLTGHEKPQLEEKQWLQILLASILVGFLLLVCVAAPTAYGMLAYPEQRAWMLGRFVTTLSLILAGFSAGVLSHRFMDRIIDTCMMSIIILIIFSLYPLRAAWQEVQHIPEWQAIARDWDVRNTTIQASVDMGERELLVPAFDSIGTVAELKDDPSYWVNVCAAQYYEVDEIIAVEVIE